MEIEIAKKKFKEFLPEHAILSSEDDRVAYGSDWTRTPGRAGIVVAPKDTSEVVKILKICAENKWAVVPSGGRTGLAGGAVAKKGEVVLTLQRMKRIDPVDTLGATVRVEAGAVTEAVHEHCAPHGLTWPIDLAAKGTSQIGGNLSTNAGGIRVIRYGMSRKWVSAIQAVTIQGNILELNRGLEKNNTGYDLLQLLIGSEGTLAVITEATLKLVRIPKLSMVVGFSHADLKSLESLFERARSGPFQILAFEFFSKDCLEVVSQKLGRKTPFQNPGNFYSILEIELSEGLEARAAVDSWLADLWDASIVSDGAVGDSTESKKSIWCLREGITESLAMSGTVRKYDVSVPVRQCASFLKDASELFQKLKLTSRLFLFGHFGDGSPHLNFLRAPTTPEEKFHQEVDQYEKELYPLIRSYGGSVSSEHGVGLLKKSWVTFSRTPEELRLYRAIKNAFDPEGLLNPGKIID